MNILLKYFLIAVISLVVTIGTLYIPLSVSSKKEMDNVWLGYPLSFVHHDLSRLDPPVFPRKYRLMSILEYPTEIIWTNFIVSYALMFLAGHILVLIYKRIRTLK